MSAAALLQSLPIEGTAVALLGAALAVALPCSGSATGVGTVGRAGAGLLSVAPEKFSRVLVMQILPGTQGLYGLVIWFFALTKLGFFSGSLAQLTIFQGLEFLGACLPVAIVNGYGDTNILTRCVNSQMIERNGKMLADSGFGMVAHACYIMSGKEVKDALVPGTLSQCFKIGKTIREANEVGKDPVAAAAEAAGGYVLAKTKMVKKEGKTIDGLYYGTLELEGVDEFAGNTYKLWFENEYHVMWKNGKPWITSPDIVQCVDTKTCHPLTNTVIEVGDFVSIVGVPAREQYNSGKPFSVMNPRYYDFEFDHVPMAEVLRQENA